MASKSLYALISLVLLAGALVFMFFILLAGAVDGFPVNRFYLLQADTSNIPNAPSISRWSYWNICAKEGAQTVCGSEHYSKVAPAFPLDPPSHREFRTHENVPEAFIGTSYYFYMTRFMFAFMLISLFFGVVAFFLSILALCTRLGAYLASLFTALAFVFQAIQASLMTTAYTKGRNHFRHNGQSAHVGAYAFGFQWAALACFLISFVLLWLAGGSSREHRSQQSGPPRGTFFGPKRSKSTRSRGSFIDDIDSRDGQTKDFS
ncbi:hypothetical protein DV738_g1560, partial [Chaetothyriales sp. CBS 135597]